MCGWVPRTGDGRLSGDVDSTRSEVSERLDDAANPLAHEEGVTGVEEEAKRCDGGRGEANGRGVAFVRRGGHLHEAGLKQQAEHGRITVGFGQSTKDFISRIADYASALCT